MWSGRGARAQIILWALTVVRFGGRGREKVWGSLLCTHHLSTRCGERMIILFGHVRADWWGRLGDSSSVTRRWLQQAPGAGEAAPDGSPRRRARRRRLLNEAAGGQGCLAGSPFLGLLGLPDNTAGEGKSLPYSVFKLLGRRRVIDPTSQ